MWSVLDLGRPASVLEVGGFTPGARFFFWRSFRVGYDRVSLWEIEHERIRHRTMDYRVHAAMNCASASCPPLRAGLYTSPGVERQLNDQMRRWVEDPERGVRVESGALVLNPIFDWFARDFSQWTGGDDLCAVTARHATGDLRAAILAVGRAGCPHRFASYDWSLNDASGSWRKMPDPE
jgi:hypothetical protein